MAFHPGKPANVITVSADKTAAVHTLTIQRTIAVSPLPIRSIALVPNGQQIITGGDDKAVKMWNLGNGTAERSFAGAAAPVLAVAVAKNGALVATAGADKTVRLYNFADGALDRVVPGPRRRANLEFSSKQSSAGQRRRRQDDRGLEHRLPAGQSAAAGIRQADSDVRQSGGGVRRDVRRRRQQPVLGW